MVPPFPSVLQLLLRPECVRAPRGQNSYHRERGTKGEQNLGFSLHFRVFCVFRGPTPLLLFRAAFLARVGSVVMAGVA